MKVLCLGDVVGRPGRSALAKRLRSLSEELSADFVVVNGENSAGGLGINQTTADEIRASGAHVITLGDHTWQKKEAKSYIDSQSDWIVRPANYPPGAPGRGWTVRSLEIASSGAAASSGQSAQSIKVGVFNLLGRVFMNFPLDCPFRVADSLLSNELKGCSVLICDMHAEATSEKIALGKYLDGRVSVVFGTHTHVQTADETILPGGTAYISDLGMTGCTDGVIGMDTAIATKRFLSGLPLAYEVAEGAGELHGILVDINQESGRASSIVRVRAREA